MFDPAFPNSVVSDNTGRCVAMVVPQRDGDLPMYRCVGEGTLHVHISAVRKALGPDRAMLKTVSGRGYRLLGSWTPQQREATAPPVYSSLTRTPGASPAL